MLEPVDLLPANHVSYPRSYYHSHSFCQIFHHPRLKCSPSVCFWCFLPKFFALLWPGLVNFVEFSQLQLLWSWISACKSVQLDFLPGRLCIYAGKQELVILFLIRTSGEDFPLHQSPSPRSPRWSQLWPAAALQTLLGQSVCGWMYKQESVHNFGGCKGSLAPRVTDL